MLLKLVFPLAFMAALAVAESTFYETSGFHCKSKISMALDHKLHGAPRDAPPPFDVQVLDEDGHQTEYYEPGKIYTVRLIGYQYYRGLILQARLCDEHGFVIGSLRGGRFLETPDWIQYGIRLQECDMKYPLEDSVTHADDSRKFVTQVQWTTSRDVGNVQFMFTIASENDVYWERWRPRSGFIQPVYSKQFPSEVLRQVFYNEKYALKFLAGKFTSQETKMSVPDSMPKLEEILVSTEKPQMPMEAKQVLSKMENPEFWQHHDGEAKVKEEEKTDVLQEKPRKEGESTLISDMVNSGEAHVDDEMVEEITNSEEEKIEVGERPFVGDMTPSNNTAEATTSIPAHESITHKTDTVNAETTATEASIDSGEATIAHAAPTLQDVSPLVKEKPFEEAFSHDVIEKKEPGDVAPAVTTDATTEALMEIEKIETTEASTIEATTVNVTEASQITPENLSTTLETTETTSDVSEATTTEASGEKITEIPEATTEATTLGTTENSEKSTAISNNIEETTEAPTTETVPESTTGEQDATVPTTKAAPEADQTTLIAEEAETTTEEAPTSEKEATTETEIPVTESTANVEETTRTEVDSTSVFETVTTDAASEQESVTPEMITESAQEVGDTTTMSTTDAQTMDASEGAESLETTSEGSVTEPAKTEDSTTESTTTGSGTDEASTLEGEAQEGLKTEESSTTNNPLENEATITTIADETIESKSTSGIEETTTEASVDITTTIEAEKPIEESTTTAMEEELTSTTEITTSIAEETTSKTVTESMNETITEASAHPKDVRRR